jgi:hypothetical protein
MHDRAARRALSSIVVLLTALLASSAAADVTLVSKSSGTGLGMTTEGEVVTRVQALKMRSDVTIRGETMSAIIDLEGAQFISLRHRDRAADVYDMHAAAEGLGPTRTADLSVSLRPTGRTRSIAGQNCLEHVLHVRVPISADAAGTASVVMHGTVWIAPQSPGRDEWGRFYRTAADRGLFFADPRAVKADPERAGGLTALYRHVADLGVLYAADIEIGAEGATPTTERMTRMGAASTTSEVLRVATTPVDDELFTIPHGYAVTKK